MKPKASRSSPRRAWEPILNGERLVPRAGSHSMTPSLSTWLGQSMADRDFTNGTRTTSSREWHWPGLQALKVASLRNCLEAREHQFFEEVLGLPTITTDSSWQCNLT